MNGVLVVDKPAGPTSHDVVASVRGMVRPSRTGHTGTLDPLATGVLPVCIGAATRLARFLSGGLKVYLGEMLLGTSTDTYDRSGTVTARRPVEGVTLERLAGEAGRLTGRLMQTPPPWSAKRIGGRRAYQLARSGEARAPAPCAVEVKSFRISDLQGGRAGFLVECSGGTYVRSLVHDLGESLGCGAHLSALRRLRSGSFTMEQALPLDSLLESREALLEALVPMESLDLGMATALLTPEGAALAVHGRIIPGGGMESPPPPGEGPVRMLDPAGRLVGIAEPAGGGRLQPRVILGGGPAARR